MTSIDFLGDPFYAAARLETDLAEVDRAIRMAGIRALSVPELIGKLPDLLDDDDRERIIYRLGENRAYTRRRLNPR